MKRGWESYRQWIHSWILSNPIILDFILALIAYGVFFLLLKLLKELNHV